MSCSIEDRRDELVTLLTATCAPHPVCDDIPDALAARGAAAIVVTWVATRWTDQWLHTFEVWIIPTAATAGPFFADRDRIAAKILTQLAGTNGTIGRPSAAPAAIQVGDRLIERCTAITTTVTDGPISSGG